MSSDTPTTDKRDAYTEDGEKISLNVESLGGTSTLSKADSSTQLPDRRIQSLNLGVKPPYNPDRLAAFLELNETLATGIRKKSRYEVGYGFSIVTVDDVDDDEADQLEGAAVENFWRGRDSKWLTGPRRSAEPTTPEEVKELARQDYHAIGWLALEVLVNAEGVPVGLAHVPANTVRVRKSDDDEDARGYVQRRGGKTRYFGEFGDRYRGLEASISGSEEEPTVTYASTDDDEEPIFVDKENGDVVRGDATQLDNGPANELIFVRNPSPLEQDYGVPDWVSAIRTITADEAAKDYNREFFDNDTIPRFVIKVKGGELTEESKRDLKQMLHGLREENHRTVILEVEKFQTQIDEDVEIDLEPLGQGISEEMDFRQFREKNEHEIAKVLEVPPILIGVTETSNRSNSKEQVREFATDVVAPEQHKFAERLYQTLHQQAFGVTDWTIEYELRGADQPKEEARMTEQRVRSMRLSGVPTVNQVLEELGLPTREDEYGDMMLAEFEAEFAGGGGEGGETEASRPDHAPPPENKIGERDWAEVEAALDVENGVATKDPIEQQQFNSSNLDEGLFDFGENELYLSFKRDDGPNSLYVYVDVPTSEWAGLVNASSHGSYHYDNIRLVYPYLEITNHHDRLPEGPSPDSEDVPEDIPL